MTIETHSDQQREARLLGEAELAAVDGGDAGTAATLQAIAVNFQYHGIRIPPPPPDPCRD
jgi:hypothetical protein